MNKYILLLLIGFSSFANSSLEKDSLEFYHHNWEVTCDNTNTCRFAGYPEEDLAIYNSDDYHNASIYFERKAGENTDFTSGMIILEHYEQDKPVKFEYAELFLNGKSLGKLKINDDSPAVLTDQQVKKLVDSAKKNNKIELKTDNFSWIISDRGLAAVLLKAHEYQTLKTYTAPQKVTYQKVPNFKKLELMDNQKEAILTDLKAYFSKQDEDNLFCGSFSDIRNNVDNEVRDTITAYQLTENEILIESLCTLAAYNYSSVFFLTDKHFKIQRLLSADMQELEFDKEKQKLSLSASYKSRGIGDCWSSYGTVWNGKDFVQIANSHSGMCRGFAGGAWTFPRFVTEVVDKN